MSAHTPGPWVVEIERIGRDSFHNVFASDGEERVATIARVETESRSAADARLIAAAPDLLAALEALVPDEPPADVAATESTRIVCLVGELRRARAAIAKAVGK